MYATVEPPCTYNTYKYNPQPNCSDQKGRFAYVRMYITYIHTLNITFECKAPIRQEPCSKLRACNVVADLNNKVTRQFGRKYKYIHTYIAESVQL